MENMYGAGSRRDCFAAWCLWQTQEFACVLRDVSARVLLKFGETEGERDLYARIYVIHQRRSFDIVVASFAKWLDEYRVPYAWWDWWTEYMCDIIHRHQQLDENPALTALLAWVKTARCDVNQWRAASEAGRTWLLDPHFKYAVNPGLSRRVRLD
jgi:hypothetical protein